MRKPARSIAFATVLAAGAVGPVPEGLEVDATATYSRYQIHHGCGLPPENVTEPGGHFLARYGHESGLAGSAEVSLAAATVDGQRKKTQDLTALRGGYHWRYGGGEAGVGCTLRDTSFVFCVPSLGLWGGVPEIATLRLGFMSGPALMSRSFESDDRPVTAFVAVGHEGEWYDAQLSLGLDGIGLDARLTWERRLRLGLGWRFRGQTESGRDIEFAVTGTVGIALPELGGSAEP